MGRTETKTLAIASLAFIAGVALAKSIVTREDLMFHPHLGLAAYPGARVVDQDVETEFESTASLEDVFAFVDEQLEARGWQKTEVDESEEEIEARYTRGDRSLTLELEVEGENLYELEIEMED